MQAKEQEAILTIALLAAFADGNKDDSEREAVRRLADSLGRESGGAGLASLYQDVLLKRVTLADAVVSMSDRRSGSWPMKWPSASATRTVAATRLRRPS